LRGWGEGALTELLEPTVTMRVNGVVWLVDPTASWSPGGLVWKVRSTGLLAWATKVARLAGSGSPLPPARITQMQSRV
jgi:hypothetical protein